MRWMHWTVIFHCDLKAENLLLDSALNIKIAGTWFYSELCLSLSEAFPSDVRLAIFVFLFVSQSSLC